MVEEAVVELAASPVHKLLRDPTQRQPTAVQTLPRPAGRPDKCACTYATMSFGASLHVCMCARGLHSCAFWSMCIHVLNGILSWLPWWSNRSCHTVDTSICASAQSV